MSASISAVIIDDESRARRVLETLLQEYCPHVQVVATAEDVPSGVKAITKHQPDLVFLDVEMPGYTGFQLFDFFEQPNFKVIFTTAYAEYALQAFRVSATDYLLKPIQADMLTAAVDKVVQANNLHTKDRVRILTDNLRDGKLQKLALPVAKGMLFVDVPNIICLKADGSYVEMSLSDKTQIIVTKSLRDFEDLLTVREGFFRTHRSFIVNLTYIRQYLRQESMIVMEHGIQVALARDRYDEFKRLVDHPGSI